MIVLLLISSVVLLWLVFNNVNLRRELQHASRVLTARAAEIVLLIDRLKTCDERLQLGEDRRHATIEEMRDAHNARVAELDARVAALRGLPK